MTTTCRHCARAIVKEGHWIDPEATGDDSVWRETCDSHDTFTAEHEPLTIPCAACGAEAGEECFPGCIGKAAHEVCRHVKIEWLVCNACGRDFQPTVDHLRAAGWDSVADDLEDGVRPELVLSRLRDIGEADSDAATIMLAATS